MVWCRYLNTCFGEIECAFCGLIVYRLKLVTEKHMFNLALTNNIISSINYWYSKMILPNQGLQPHDITSWNSFPLDNSWTCIMSYQIFRLALQHIFLEKGIYHRASWHTSRPIKKCIEWISFLSISEDNSLLHWRVRGSPPVKNNSSIYNTKIKGIPWTILN